MLDKAKMIAANKKYSIINLKYSIPIKMTKLLMPMKLLSATLQRLSHFVPIKL
jgi:hypothetical protein